MGNENINIEDKGIQNIREEVKERLIHVFGMRLQTLIDFKDSAYQEKIVEHFLCWMEKLSENPNNHNQYEKRLKDIHKILYFNNENNHIVNRSTIIESTANSIKSLCTYVEYLYNKLAFQIFGKELDDVDIRKKIGERFTEKMKKTARQCPRQDIYNQLNVATLQRNTFFHQHDDGDSKNYTGFELLIGYDVLMACLLYTFYKMVFEDIYKPA